jgi:hypothetical protein
LRSGTRRRISSREVGFRRGDDLLEAVGLGVGGADLLDVGRVLLGPEEIAARERHQNQQRQNLAALIGR